MKKLSTSIVSTLVVIVIFAQCETVKPYKRVYLNDREMGMGAGGARAFEENVHAYREGAVGGGSKKVSGGCGCN
jgi:hypothetical protein